VTSLTELTDGFNQILSDVLKTNTTFSAPVVAVSAFNWRQELGGTDNTVVFTPRNCVE
jgi:hypothetical protein